MTDTVAPLPLINSRTTHVTHVLHPSALDVSALARRQGPRLAMCGRKIDGITGTQTHGAFGSWATDCKGCAAKVAGTTQPVKASTTTDQNLQTMWTDQLRTIAAQVHALQHGTVTNRAGAVALLLNNVHTLSAWEGLLPEEGAPARCSHRRDDNWQCRDCGADLSA